MKTLVILLFGFILGCSNGSSNAIPYPSEEKSMAYDETVMLEEVNELKDVSEEDNIRTEQQIIKEGRLSFETDNPEETHQKILSLTQQYQGFVASDNSGKNYNRYYRNMVIRVPTNNFQAVIDGISEGVEYFDQKDISRRDVTEEFVDLQARLKAKRELENRYLELLRQAKNVKEMLEIERELSNIREEIEAKQGRLNYLKDKVAMSTLSIEFYKQTTETGVTVSYGQKMLNSLKGGWDGISVFFLGILYLWPLFFIAIIAILLIRWWIRHRKHSPAPTSKK